MEGEGSILDTVLGEDAEDFEMTDVEEGELIGLQGELVGLDLQSDPVQDVGGDVNFANQEANSKHSKRRKKKKKKPRKKKGNKNPDEIDIDRFVLDVCKRLNERKTHMVYTAVGCLGVAALSDLINEVDAIQACGGQKIANGKRFRNGGGILWNILKTRDPNAYKEIMKKTREFERQFSQRKRGQGSVQKEEVTSERAHPELTNDSFLDHGPVENQLNHSNLEKKHAPVRDRIRMPVTYDDLLDDESQKTQTT